jgi:hypothetical protein
MLRRLLRLVLLFPLMGALFGIWASAERAWAPIVPHRAVLNVAPVTGIDRVNGPLRLLGAWSLTSTDPDFGGISALLALGDARLVALSDAGGVFRFTADGTPRVAMQLSQIPRGCGLRGLKKFQDSEAMAADPATGAVWIALERRDELCRTDGALAATSATQRPPAMAPWPNTGGAEAMVRLADGRFLVFAERDADSTNPVTPVLVFDGDPAMPGTAVTRRAYRAPAGYRPADAAQLPDGRILVLNRRFALPFRFSARLVAIDPGALDGDAVLRGAIVARFGPPALAENFEALAAERTAQGTILWIAADNNFLGLQRTLLLKYRLVP